jgi:hypothetical protein
MTYLVRDRYTHNIIYRGGVQNCLDYIQAFGLCYLDKHKGMNQ